MATILIVDDSPSEAALMTKAIQELGHSAYHVTDGEQAVEAASRLQPAMVFLDVVMPKMDGFKACRSLKKTDATAQIPVVMVTSKNQESDQFWAERQGANGYITKPFSPQSITDAVRKWVG